MPCPRCGAEDRLCVKNGRVYRKTEAGSDHVCGAKVQRYLCTGCGKMGRGKMFNLPEFPWEEKPVEVTSQCQKSENNEEKQETQP